MASLSIVFQIFKVIARKVSAQAIWAFIGNMCSAGCIVWENMRPMTMA